MRIDAGFAALAAGFLIAGITLELIRRRKLAESYALPWLALGLFAGVLGLIPGALPRLAGAVHLGETAMLPLAAGLLVALTGLLQLMAAATKMQRKMTRLVQELALLRSSGCMREGEEDIHERSADRQS